MRHQSVLLRECVRYLDIDPAGTYVDGTLGMGGHSEAVLRQLPQGRLIGIDRDERALEYAGARLAPFDIAELREIMSYDELKLDEVGDKKTALFFLISDTDST